MQLVVVISRAPDPLQKINFKTTGGESFFYPFYLLGAVLVRHTT